MKRRDVLVGAGASLLSVGLPSALLADTREALRPSAPPDFRRSEVATPRHRTAYIKCGSTSNPLMIFLHGFPELGLVWKAQMAFFSARGWHCVAPDMRGYGGSSAPTDITAYTVAEIAADMVELHTALGGAPAIWVGHDWGAPIAWTIASHHPERCRGIAALSVPYHPRGHALPNLVPLVDRRMYPENRFPVGQWDYWLYYRESLPLVRRDFERDVTGTINALYQAGKPGDVDTPSPTASIRQDGGWFGPIHRPPSLPSDDRLLSRADHDELVATFRRTGFLPAVAWYLNDAANLQHAAMAKQFGRIDLPALFIDATYDPVDGTLRNKLAEPMRLDCTDLTEARLPSGHFVMLELKEEVCGTIDGWLATKVR